MGDTPGDRGISGSSIENFDLVDLPGSILGIDAHDTRTLGKIHV